MTHEPSPDALTVGFFTILAVIVTFGGQWLLNWWHRRERIRGAKQGVYDELKELYDKELGVHWKKFEDGRGGIFVIVDWYSLRASLIKSTFP